MTLYGHTEKAIFQKLIVATKRRGFYLQNRNSVCQCFKRQESFLRNKKNTLCSQRPKTLFFWAFFWNIPFPCFWPFLFFFSNLKKAKQKMHFLFENPFLTPRQPANKIFRAPTRYLCLFKIPKNTKNWGKTSKINLGLIFDSTLDRFLTQRRPNLGQIFDSTAQIYAENPYWSAQKERTELPNIHISWRSLVELGPRRLGLLVADIQNDCQAPVTHKPQDAKKKDNWRRKRAFKPEQQD